MMTMGRTARLDGLVGLVDVEFHPIEFLQEVVRELDVGLVDLVDQQDWALSVLSNASHILPFLM